MEEQILDTWRIHNRVHFYLLDAITPEALAASLAKGRNVAEEFAHIHNNRLSWLKAAAPELLEGLAKLEKDNLQKETIRAALIASGTAIKTLLTNTLVPGGRVKNFKPHPVAFMGYLISHESHHRGEIGMLLAQSGHPLDKATDFGLWAWGVR